MRFDVTMESVERLIAFEPEESLPFNRRIGLLLIHAERDRVVPIDEAHSVFELAREPKQLVVLPGAEHHDVHSGETFESCLKAIDSFLSSLE